MSTRIVPDEVWMHLDPHAGQLARRTRRRVTVFVLALTVGLILFVAGGIAGMLYPRFAVTFAGRGYSWAADPADVARHAAWLRLHVTNNNYVSETISAVSSDSPLARIDTMTPSAFTLAPYTGRDIRVRVEVRNCRSVRHSTEVPLAVVSGHWWGHLSDAAKWESGPGLHGPAGVAWAACHGG